MEDPDHLLNNGANSGPEEIEILKEQLRDLEALLVRQQKN